MQNDENPNQIKYPFNGRSKYLIDKFCIIGFDPSYIRSIVMENKIYENIPEKKKLSEAGTFSEKDKNSTLIPLKIKSSSPMLISEMSCDYTKEIISVDIIKDLIFPKGCQFYYEFKEPKPEGNNSDKDINSIIEINKSDKLNPYFVTFSNNPQIENNSKKSINCFSYIFYKLQEIILAGGKRLYFYAPFSFCIISEFPFFNNYYTLCKQLYELFNQPNEVPLEIILYNIVHFIPSPLNYSVTINLNIFNESRNSIGNSSEKNLRISYDELSKKINSKNSNEELIVNRKKTHKQSMKNNKKKKENSLPEEIKYFHDIKFEILSGYPLIQYNLLKVLLYKLSPEDVIIIFFYTFLERNVLFFSNDIELLSLTIYSYINLNFPLNDEKYYFNSVSISLEDYKGGNSNFSGTAFTSVLGINSEYKEDYATSNTKLGYHLAVDLDNGVVNMSNQDKSSGSSKGGEKEVIEELVIFKFFKKIFKNKEIKENAKSTILYKEVKNIFDFLTDLKRKINDKTDNLKKIFEMKYIDYYDVNEYIYTNDKQQCLIKYYNSKIQEAFYSLVNNLCIYFYDNLSFANPAQSQSKNEKEKIEAMDFIFNDNFIQNSDYIKEEISFLNELRDTMKFQSFVFSFIKYYNPIDLYKIPLTFTEEFLSVLSSKSTIYKENKNKINFLTLIDLIYIKKDKTDYKLDFVNFYDLYNNNYKKYIDMELLRLSDNEEINLTLKEDENKNISVSSIRYLNFELENVIIFTYKYIIDNIDKSENNLILNYIDKINENNLENMKMNLIEDSIEKNLMEVNLITPNDICFSNIIILFIINMKNLKFKNDSHIFITSLFRHAKIFRNYYRMFMEVACTLLMDSIKNENYEEAGNYIMIYFYYINSLRSLRLIPNENLYRYIKKFESIATANFKKIVEVENSNNKEVEVDDTELNYVYISRNFTATKTIEEEEVIKYKNKLLKTGLKSALDEALKLKMFNPRITFNNKKLKLDFVIISQIEVFSKLKDNYNNYILNGLDNLNLNLSNLLGLCANIIIYFKYMEDFNEKEEVNNILIEIYDAYLDSYIEKKNQEKKPKNT